MNNKLISSLILSYVIIGITIYSCSKRDTKVPLEEDEISAFAKTKRNSNIQSKSSVAECKTYSICDYYTECSGLIRFTSTKTLGGSCTCPPKAPTGCSTPSNPCNAWIFMGQYIQEECTTTPSPPIPPDEEAGPPFAKTIGGQAQQTQNGYEYSSTYPLYIYFYSNPECTIPYVLAEAKIVTLKYIDTHYNAAPYENIVTPTATQIVLNPGQNSYYIGDNWYNGEEDGQYNTVWEDSHSIIVVGNYVQP